MIPPSPRGASHIHVPTGKPFDVCQDRRSRILLDQLVPVGTLRIFGNKDSLKKWSGTPAFERLRLLPDVRHLAPAGLHKKAVFSASAYLFRYDDLPIGWNMAAFRYAPVPAGSCLLRMESAALLHHVPMLRPFVCSGPYPVIGHSQ